MMPYPPEVFWAITYLSGYVLTFIVLFLCECLLPSISNDDPREKPIVIICCATIWPVFWIWIITEINKRNPWK